MKVHGAPTVGADAPLAFESRSGLWTGRKPSGACYAAAVSAATRNPHLAPMREGGRTLLPRSNHAMRLQANLLVKNALAKVGIERGDNGSIYPRPKGKPR